MIGRWRIVIFTILFAVSTLAVSCALVHADDFFWRAGQNGNFTDPARWSPSGLPGSGDAAVFRVGEGEAYTVTFPSPHPAVGEPVNYMTHELRVGSNVVNLSRTFGSTYTVLNPAATDVERGIIVGELPGV